ncbi:MAG: hypothetical protein KAQ62_07850, partial [Cyclobacteriaceae bacterium]|nr:hypothetical protein [Cyclobacteriaceae bacterium]
PARQGIFSVFCNDVLRRKRAKKQLQFSYKIIANNFLGLQSLISKLFANRPSTKADRQNRSGDYRIFIYPPDLLIDSLIIAQSKIESKKMAAVFK